jgi:hypothetical protein
MAASGPDVTGKASWTACDTANVISTASIPHRVIVRAQTGGSVSVSRGSRVVTKKMPTVVVICPASATRARPVMM